MGISTLIRPGQGSLPWEDEAEQALARVPGFVRPLVRRKVRERVAAQGRSSVTLADFREAEAAFRRLTAGKSDQEIESMMPRPNQKGASLVVVEACRAKAVGCPNSLLDTGPWIEALEDWAARFDLSEKLRGLVAEDRILFHHKIKFSVSGCPNGCSRPQIADFGLRARVRPIFDPDGCTLCGACAEVCPDQALSLEGGPLQWDRDACLGCLKCSSVCPAGCVTLASPQMELLVGGKLGRRPHLAEPVGIFSHPAELVLAIVDIMANYLNNTSPGQRFADFWLENG